MPASTDDNDDDNGVDNAERLVLRAVAALVAFVLAAGVGLLATRLDDGDDDVVGTGVVEQEARFSGEGPPAGADIPSYVTTRRLALDGMGGRVVAAVSFDGYRNEGQARTALVSVKVRALLVAAPGGRPAAVRGSLASWARQERADAEVERESLLRVLETTTDPAFVAQYRADVDRLTAMLDRLEPVGAVVFGAVVEADAEGLRRLAGRSQVRLVDPAAPRMDDADVERLVGLRPEETTRAGDPPTRPL